MKEDRSRGSTWYARTEAEMKLGWARVDASTWGKPVPFALELEIDEASIYAKKDHKGGWWMCSFRAEMVGCESGLTRAIAATNLIRAKLREIEKDAAAAVVTA